ncbi:MAG: hypothetical protein KKC84_05630 [Candidatus Omnitrophica bacterium]|nr:hypothetical protein [Candidatus Omnitrophota bacterium]
MMKAIILLSGGLDSTLAARLMQDLGIELIALNAISPFCTCTHASAQGKSCGASTAAEQLHLPLRTVNVAEEFLPIVKDPPHGYGSHMNPCIDCRILLFKKAKELMEKENAAFIITGEVVGQRPMSQKRHTMQHIERSAGLEGWVVRPLSAGVLKPTIPEQRGWIPRDKLLGLNGRGRREQFNLAADFGINDYPCPSGGCLLTDPGYSRRVKDLIQHHEFNRENITLLRLGRHFRVASDAKIVVGRDQKEGDALLKLARSGDFVFMPCAELAGATMLGRGVFSDVLIEIALRINACYCDLNGNTAAGLVYFEVGKEKKSVQAVPLEKERLESMRV